MHSVAHAALAIHVAFVMQMGRMHQQTASTRQLHDVVLQQQQQQHHQRQDRMLVVELHSSVTSGVTIVHVIMAIAVDFCMAKMTQDLPSDVDLLVMQQAVAVTRSYAAQTHAMNGQSVAPARMETAVASHTLKVA